MLAANAVVGPNYRLADNTLGASTRFARTRPAMSSAWSTVSRASGASLANGPSLAEAARSAAHRAIEAVRSEAASAREHQRNRPGEAVLMPAMTLPADEHLLRNSISDTMGPVPNASRSWWRKGE